MKIVRTPKTDRIEAFDGPTESITPAGYDEFMAPVYVNKLRILSCAFDIETLLEQWISSYFFRDAPESDRRNDFMNQIITSEWCSFGAKRRLAMFFVNSEKLLHGNEKNVYDKLLRNCVSYRNAFAHGALSTDGRKVKLKYFEGAPKERFIDDGWLNQIEQDLTQCFRLTFKLSTGHEFPDSQHPQ